MWWEADQMLLWVGTQLQVWFKGRNILFVWVGPKYHGGLRGLWGNFHRGHSDDKSLSSGAPVPRNTNVSNAWQTQDRQPR